MTKVDLEIAVGTVACMYVWLIGMLQLTWWSSVLVRSVILSVSMIIDGCSNGHQPDMVGMDNLG